MTARRQPSRGKRGATGTKPAGAGDSFQEGVVIADYGRALAVEDRYGKVFRCVIPRRVERPVTGDRVHWKTTAKRHGAVEALLPRRNLLSRPAPRGGTRPLVANLDHLVIVVAVEPGFQEILIDRYLVAAEFYRVPAAIVLNKVDMVNAGELAALRARLAVYESIGYPLRLSSTRGANGLDALTQLLHQGNNILVGQSGVGKSSLVHHLLPDQGVVVGRLNEATGLGRHTTTATTLYHLPGGGNIIDSPGVRDFGLWHIPDSDIAQGFVEFREYLGRCRFRDCRHREEPGCALREALGEGAIDAGRFANFHTILASPTE